MILRKVEARETHWYVLVDNGEHFIEYYLFRSTVMDMSEKEYNELLIFLARLQLMQEIDIRLLEQHGFKEDKK